MSTDWHTATLHAYEAKVDRDTKHREDCESALLRNWRELPQVYAAEALSDGLLDDRIDAADMLTGLMAEAFTRAEGWERRAAELARQLVNEAIDYETDLATENDDD